MQYRVNKKLNYGGNLELGIYKFVPATNGEKQMRFERIEKQSNKDDVIIIPYKFDIENVNQSYLWAESYFGDTTIITPIK